MHAVCADSHNILLFCLAYLVPSSVLLAILAILLRGHLTNYLFLFHLPHTGANQVFQQRLRVSFTLVAHDFHIQWAQQCLISMSHDDRSNAFLPSHRYPAPA